MARVLLALALFVLAGCEDRYRYPCQNPDNYAKPECLPPACVADGSCTEYVVRHK